MTEEHQDHQAPVEAKVDEAERDLADLEQRAEDLGEQIDDTRSDWEGKKADPSVPGAAGDPSHAEEGGRHPETAYPAKGPDDEATTPDPADNDRGEDDTPSSG
jgi:hypothetical protein